MMPLVSILIPTYNRARFLREAIESARVQTYAALEILILDDASSDETPTVAREFSHDSRVRYVRHTRNLGITGNWAAGLTLAQGSFFCFLHDDDTFAPTFVEQLVEPLVRDEGLILSFCDHWAISANGERLPQDTEEIYCRFARNRLPPGVVSEFPRVALVDYSVPVGATIFRRSLVGPEMIDIRARGAIDAYLLYRCVLTGKTAFYLNHRLMNYRIHATGMSVSMPLHMVEGHLYRLQKILGDPRMTEIHEETRRALGEALADYGIALLCAGRHQESRMAFADALQRGWCRRSLVGLALASAGPLGSSATSWWRGRANRKYAAVE